MIILTTIKLHSIFYAQTSYLDKYCEKEMHNMQNILNRTWRCGTKRSYVANEGI